MTSGPQGRLLSKSIVLSLVALMAACAGVYVILWWIDFGMSTNVFELWTSAGAVSTLSGLGEVTVAVLGIALTVVAIVVELSANRYTARVTDLFLRAPVNVLTLSFFVLTCVLVLWVNMSLYGEHLPKAMVLAAVGSMTASLIALLPYFAYVFDFLTPEKVIRRIEERAAQGIAAGTRPLDGRRFDSARQQVINGIEQLGDMVVNSIEKKDKLIAIESLAALASLAARALREKSRLPERWFETGFLTDGDPDFVALHRTMIQALEQRKTWMEMKIFRQYQGAFTDCVGEEADLGHLIAIHTRGIGSYASAVGDMQTLTMAMRFMNTYLRASINKGDVRTAYNVLNEYRMLAENLVVRGYEPLVVELAGYMKYYGQLAFHMNKAFILETAAYDLCALLEKAHRNQADVHDSLLEIFLDVDREPEGGRAQETALRGVRKAQVKLATHYLEAGDEHNARRIFEDMRDELPSRLKSIRHELESIEEAEYWEVSDRGINFDYLAPARRKRLAEFFGWFEQDQRPMPIPMALDADEQ